MNERLIEKFFKKECTPQEAEEVAHYLKNNPSVLDKYLNASEWFNEQSQAMPAEFWSESWNDIKEKSGIKTRSRISAFPWLKAAAAAVLIVTSAAVYQNYSTKEKPHLLASVEKHNPSPERKITVNNSAEPMHINLPDSSAITLSPGSLITYHVPFAQLSREIKLDGEARFKVKKNEQKPFTVYAGGLATTALGTEFTINTKNKVSVKLHNGRVMITATGEAVKHWKKNIILEPGQELNYSVKEMTASVGIMATDKAVAQHIQVKKPRQIITKEPAGLSFVNTSLPEVLNTLMKHYHQTIKFDHAELDDMNFTGNISENDSLPVVLKIITQMNNLALSQTDDYFEIKK